MREFTKSMMSYTWAMSVFGVQQVFNVFRPAKAAQSFDSVTKATEEELGDALKATFHAGDNMQKGLVDVTFGVLTLGTSGRGGATTTADVAQQTGEALRQGGRVVGKAVESITQTVQSATSAVAGAAQQSGGWAATPSMSRDANPQSRKEPTPGPGAAPSGGAPGGGQQGWGPMPPQGSQAPRK
jgi:hypothetical protein